MIEAGDHVLVRKSDKYGKVVGESPPRHGRVLHVEIVSPGRWSGPFNYYEEGLVRVSGDEHAVARIMES